MINRLYPESPIGDYYIGQYHETGNNLKNTKTALLKFLATTQMLMATLKM